MLKGIFVLLILLCSLNVIAFDYKLFFNERIRYTSVNNGISLSKELGPDLQFNRVKTSIGGKLNINCNFQFNIGLTNEFRYYYNSRKDFSFNEIFIEKFNLLYKFKNLKLKIGRQNIIFGEGFVFLDGSPVDGSRSIYFNGIRLDGQFKSWKFSLFKVNQPQVDDYLPLLNDNNQTLIENREKAYGFFINKNLNNLKYELLFVDKQVVALKTNVKTISNRIVYKYGNKLLFNEEFAYQWGRLNTSSQKAFGSNSYINYKITTKDSIKTGFIYLSGDKNNTTSTNEGWDPVFSRWPKWSEFYIYTLIKENNGKVAYWTNYKSYFISYLKNISKLKFELAYFKMYSNELTLTNDFLSGIGKNRGSLYKSKISYKINKNYNFHIIYEKFYKGNFYQQGLNNGNFFRIEFSMKY